MHKLRLGDEVYTGPFYADRDDDICDGTGRLIHVQAVEGAETVAHALNVFAESVAPALTIDIDIKCHWCDELIDRVTVTKHATDEERLNEVVKCISDATWIESLDTPFCSADCYNASAEAMTNPTITGADYDARRDGARLTRQYDKIVALMADGRWRTLNEISDETGAPHASVSAQLRHAKRGGYELDKRYVQNGLYEYRLTVRDPVQGNLF